MRRLTAVFVGIALMGLAVTASAHETEVIEASWVWIVLLGLVIAYSIISGLDRRSALSDS